MKKFTKAIAVLLALLMIVTAMPLSVFAEASQPASINLIIDNNNGKDDVVVSGTDGPIPSGADLYNDDGVLIGSLPLDWDFFFDSTANGKEYGYKLMRNQGSYQSLDAAQNEDATYGGWSQISMVSNYKINVLVVYPKDAQGVMMKWLTEDVGGEGPAGKDLFHIEEISLADFNAAADKSDANLLKVKEAEGDDDSAVGNPYDVVLFGTADCNGGSKDGDLTDKAQQAVAAYIAADGGVLFGHDTICQAPSAEHPNFAKFASTVGIKLVPYSNFSNPSIATEKTKRAQIVEANKDGVLLNYPWVITGKEETHNVTKDGKTVAQTDQGILNIPLTHAMYQIVDPSSGAKVWIELADGKKATADDPKQTAGNDDGVYGQLTKYTKEASNAYLVTNGNVAMIQTGHAGKGTSDDERRIFANTLFYLMDKDLISFSRDIDFEDDGIPVVQSPSTSATDAKKVAEDIKENDMTLSKPVAAGDHQEYGAQFVWTGSDVGTPYMYYVQATIGTETVAQSDKEEGKALKAVAISNLKGYTVVLKEEDSEDAIDEKFIDANDLDEISYSTPNNLETGKPYELHIIPVDRANNPGIEVVITFDQPATPPNVETEMTPVVSESDTVPEDSRVDEDVPVLDENGDPVVDEEGNPVTEDITYYYPGNYIDKEGNPFDKDGDDEVYEDDYRQVDDTIVLDIETTVDYGNREIVGTIVITDKEGNKIEVEGITDTVINANPSHDKPSSEQIKIPIEDIYGGCECPDDCDYLEDGEFTITIEWVDASTVNDENPVVVAEDESKIIVKRPDYKVTFNYLDGNKNKLVEKQKIEIVLHGEDATAPKDKKSYFKAEGEHYFFDGWDNKYTNITKNTVVNADYDNYTSGSIPEFPEEPEPEEPETKEPELVRLGGEDRIETAIEISKEGWASGSDVVILATANEFPDAMAGVPLAKAVDAPILLTINGEKLEEIVKNEIARLNPEKVYILGQTEAVNANIEKELDVLYEIERLGGKDRFGTAVEIAEEMEEVYDEKADAVYFVRSDLFPDALSVSSVAAIEHRPILYVAPNGKVDEPTTAYSKTIGTSATIIGGPEAVIEAGENNVKALYKNVNRIYGRDRYDTSVEVCTAKNSLFTGAGTALATGKKFPDALTGGSFAAKNNIPVLLVNGSVSTELSIYLSNRPIKTLYVFGGELAVSDEVAYDALEYCRYLYY